MIQFLLGWFVGRFIRIDDRPPTSNLIEKWHIILNYSRSCNGQIVTPPVPIEDRPMVASLLEQAEAYIKRHPDENRHSELISTICVCYKNMSFDFSD
jgi:hypothetical protein